MKTLMFIVAVVAIGAGLLWAAQGTGVVAWPRDSFMINDRMWAYYGLAVAIAGMLLMLKARRRR